MPALKIEKKYTGVSYNILDLPEAMLNEIISALQEVDYRRGHFGSRRSTTLDLLVEAKNK